MPSFLSKVFGRKKQDDKEHGSPTSTSSPLGGKFEAVKLSPSVTNFSDGRANGKGGRRISSSSPSPAVGTPPKTPDFPQLSLNLSEPTEGARPALGAVFEADPDSQVLLPDNVIGERRLTPQQTLVLIRICNQAIVSRGLETLGLMHPHWYSTSNDVQRKLISLFIHSLTSSPEYSTTLPLTASSTSAFESEINFTRSPHDVAAVLRWGLRHLQLEGSQFGKDQAWFKTFFDIERASSYSPKTFSTSLPPLVPSAHWDLLVALLELTSYLSAHSEANGISGSKFSKFIGLWLLYATRAQKADDWPAFYARWEQAGRQLEHLFLARIRDEAANNNMPIRLTELVKHYPYGATSDSNLLPKPRFSTRQNEALFVRVESQPTFGKTRPHPKQLVIEALGAANPAETSEEAALWGKIKTLTNEVGGDSTRRLNVLLADESLRIMAFVPGDPATRPSSPTFEEPSSKIPMPSVSRRRSFSVNDKDNQQSSNAAQANGDDASTSPLNGHTKAVSASSSEGTPLRPLGALDWSTFSTSGFLLDDTPPLAATLMDKDVEVTEPPVTRKPLSRRSTGSTIRARKSLDTPSTQPPVPSLPTVEKPKLESQTPPSKSSSIIKQVSYVQLDEAFIDFWNDALLDPVSSNWPTFVVCKISHSLLTQLQGLQNDADAKRVEWLVIEQVLAKPVQPAPPPLTIPTVSSSTAASSNTSSLRPRPSSPKPSFKSEISGSLNATKKRFSFFSKTSSTGSVTKASKSKKSLSGKGANVGEMGEILAEEPEKFEPSPVKKEEPTSVAVPKPLTSSNDAALATAVTVGAVAAATGGVVAAAALAEDEDENKVKAPPQEGNPEPTAVSDPISEPLASATPELSGDDLLTPVAERLNPISTVAETAADQETTNAPPLVDEVKVEQPSVPETEPLSLTKNDANDNIAEDIQASVSPATVETSIEQSSTQEAAGESVPDLETEPIAAPPSTEILADTPSEVPAEATPADVPETAAIPIKAEEPSVDEAPSVTEAPAVSEEPAQAEEFVSLQDKSVPLEESTTAVEPVTTDLLAPVNATSQLVGVPEPSNAEEKTVEHPVEPSTESRETADINEAYISESPKIEPLPQAEPESIEEAAVDLPAVPIVESEPEPPASTASPLVLPKTTLPVVEEKEIPIPSVEPQSNEAELPPAPESVVTSGETPGPQLALDSSEPATLALASDEEQLEEAEKEEPTSFSELTPAHVESAALAEEVSSLPAVEQKEETVKEEEQPPVVSAEDTSVVEPTKADEELSLDSAAVDEPATADEPALDEPSVSVEESLPVEEPVTVEDAAAAEPLVAADQPASSDFAEPAEESVPAREPSVLEEPAVAEPQDTKPPLLTEEDATSLTEEPIIAEEPVAAEEQTIDEPSAPVEDAMTVADPVTIENASTTEQATTVKQQIVEEPTTPIKAPSEVEETISEPLISNEEPVVPTAQEPALAVEPTPIEEPVTVEEPAVDKEAISPVATTSAESATALTEDPVAEPSATSESAQVPAVDSLADTSAPLSTNDTPELVPGTTHEPSSVTPPNLPATLVDDAQPTHEERIPSLSNEELPASTHSEQPATNEDAKLPTPVEAAKST